MSLNLREVGVEWTDHETGLKLWVHSSTYFGKRSIVEKTLNRLLPFDTTANETQDHTINNWRSAFLFVEAFIVDYECNNLDIPLVKYLSSRSKFDIEANFELFTALRYEDVRAVFDAFTETRPNAGNISEATEAEKKSSDSDS